MPGDWIPKFLEALAISPNVSGACKAADISRVVAYERRRTDPAFASAWDDAFEQSTDSLTGEAFRRARYGTKRPVFHQGEKCGEIVEYSDTLTIFLLKAHRPLVYGDKIRHEIAQLSDDELIARVASRLRGNGPAGPDSSS